MSDLAMCPGCGLLLPSTAELLDDHYYASSECRQVFNELSAYTLSLQDANFPHQFAVDAYMAQHVGPVVKPIGITFALVGLYLAYEHNYTGRQVQLAHIQLAKTPKQWPQFRFPEAKATLTVLDVLHAPEIAMLQQWGKAVWKIWEAEHRRVAEFVRERLHV